MKILLMNPPWSLKEQYASGLFKVGAVVAPLGLAYIAAVLEREGYTVEILDCIANLIELETLKKEIARIKPDIVGITCLTPMSARSVDAAKAVRDTHNCTIVMGGPHVSILPEEVLNVADVAVMGEGEQTMLEIVKCIESNGELNSIKGISFKDGDKVIITDPRPYANLDSIPLPARHLLPMSKYHPTPANYTKLPCVTMITTRGCPFGCIYCSKSACGKIVRYRSPDNVIHEVEYLIKEFNAREILFWDDVFTLNKKRAEQICDLMIEKNINIPWTCESRVDCVTENLLTKMKKAGCWQIGYGVESGDPDILKKIKKGITLEEVQRAFKWTREAGIHVRAYFMIGLPGETKGQILHTIEMAKKLDPDIAQFCITTPYPGTELFEMAKNEGSLKSVDWSNYTLIPDNPIYVTQSLTAGDLKFLLKKAYRNFYIRPSYILHRLLRIRSFTDIKRHYYALSALVDL